MSPKRIVIIGGSGFIGTVLTRHLLKVGHEVVIGDRTPSATYPKLHRFCNVCDLDSLYSIVHEDIDAIYNLAAVHRDDVTPRSLYYDVNVDGARNVCKAAETAGVSKILFASTVAVYGFVDFAADERCPFNPFNDYGKSKAEAEAVFNEWQVADGDRSLFIVRPTVVFGEGNRGNIYNLLKQLSSGYFLMIGNGRNKKSMAYVENVASFLMFGLASDAGSHVYNYTDKPDMEMNSLVLQVKKSLDQAEKIGLRVPYVLGWLGGACFDALAFITRRKFAISAIRIKKFASSSCYDSNFAMGSGFEPPYSLQEGLDRTIRSEFSQQE